MKRFILGLLIGVLVTSGVYAVGLDGDNDIVLTMPSLLFFLSDGWQGGVAKQEFLAFAHRPPDCEVVTAQPHGKVLIFTFECP